MSTSQNSPCPEVPDDTLLEIFHHLLRQPGTAIQDSDTWIPVTLSHVCSNWRALTLASPLLWTNIFLTSFSNPAILRQYLTRSRDALLRIIVAPPIISNVDLLAQTLSSQSHRFVSFYLYDIDGQMAKRVLSFFTSPAPQLQSLHILPSTQAWVDTVFDDQMPLLHDMQVFAGARRNGLMLGRKNLTLLRVCVEYVEAETLLNLLRACPTLESLALSFQRIDSDNGLRRPGGIPMIPFKCLKELRMFWPGVVAMTIFPYLSFPNTTTVKIGYSPHDSAPPVTFLRDCTSLCEITSDVRMATLELSQRLPYVICVTTLRSPQLDIEVHAHRIDLNDCEYTGFGAMPFPALSHFTIRDMGCSFPEHHWRHMFEHIPTITHLEVCAKDAITLAALRAIRIGAPDAEAILCPELTHLVLSGDVNEGQAVCEEMLSCCLARAAAGAPIISCEILLKTREGIPTPVLARLDEIGVQIINPPSTVLVIRSSALLRGP